MSATSEQFGCEHCWPATADAAWEALTQLTTDAELVDESHFMIKLRSCRQCRQRFVSAFAEMIDWKEGRDPQFWCLLPLAAQESEALAQAGRELLSKLRSLAPERRSLCHDSSDTTRSFWGLGMVIGPHD